MTAQLAPIEAIENREISVQVRRQGRWHTIGQTKVDPLSRTIHFRIEDLTSLKPHPTRTF
jgi:hypothetical protein